MIRTLLLLYAGGALCNGARFVIHQLAHGHRIMERVKRDAPWLSEEERHRLLTVGVSVARILMLIKYSVAWPLALVDEAKD